MAIRGDLLSSDLSNVFQMLALNRSRGTLIVRDHGNLTNQRRLYLDGDRVALHDRPPVRQSLALLVEMGVMDLEDYRLATHDRGAGAGGLASTPDARSNTDPEALKRLTERTQEEAILDVFLWRNVSFELDEEGSLPDGDRAYFNIDHLVMESARRQDEWLQFVETAGVHKQVYVQSADALVGDSHQLDDVARIVLEHVDGVRGSDQIVASTGLPRYFVDLKLRTLHDGGHVEPLGLTDLVTTGDRLVQRGRYLDAIRMFQTAQRLDRQNLTLHDRLADAYLKAGRVGKGCAHLRFRAEASVNAGDIDVACSVFADVVRRLPTDFRTMERCLRLMAEAGMDATDSHHEIVDGGRKLVDYYAETGQSTRALSLADCLRTVAPDPATDAIAARLQLRTGKIRDAVEIYAAQAETRRASGDTEGALELYRTLSGVDSSRRRVYQARISDIVKDRDTDHRRRRNRRRIAATLLLATVGSALYLSYALAAATEFRRQPDGSPADRNDAERWIASLRSLRASYPLTPAAGTATDRLEELSRWMSREDAKRSDLQEQTRRRRRQALETSEQLRLAGVSHMERGELSDAISYLEESLRIVRNAGTPWDCEPRIEQRIRDIRAYIHEGRRLLRSGRNAWAAGQWGEAHAALKQVADTYPRLPELEGEPVLMPVRVMAHPSDARIELSAEGASFGVHTGAVVLPFPQDTRVSVVISRPGHRTETRELHSRTNWQAQVILEKAGAVTIRTDESLACVAAMDHDRFVLVSESGRVGTCDPSQGPLGVHWTSTVPSPSRVVTTAVGPSHLLLVFEDGVARGFHKNTLALAWSVAARRSSVNSRTCRATSIGGDFLLWSSTPDAATMTRMRGRDGEALWRSTLSTGEARVCVNGDAIAVITSDGALTLHSGDDGGVIQNPAGQFTGTPAPAGEDGFFVSRRDGRGVRVTTLMPRPPEELGVSWNMRLASPSSSPGMLLLADGSVVICDQVGFSPVPLPSPAIDIVNGPTRCAIALGDDRVVVMNPRTSQICFASELRTGARNLIAMNERYLALGRGGADLVFVPIE